MPTYSTRVFLALVTVSVIVGVAAGAFIPTALSHITSQPQLTTLRTHTVYYVPSNGVLLNSMISRMTSLGIQSTALDPSKLASNDTLKSLGPTTLILMDGNWLSTHVTDNNTLTFFKTAVSQKSALVAVGGATSSIIDAATNAGVYSCTGCRNPVYYDPPAAGFRLKTTSANPQNWFPSILASNSTDVNSLLDGMDGWLINNTQ